MRAINFSVIYKEIRLVFFSVKIITAVKSGFFIR